MDRWVTVTAAQPRARRPEEARALTQLRIQDMRRVSPLERVRAAVEALRLADEGDPPELLRLLDTADAYFMSLDMLEDTGAGVVVNRLRRHRDAAVAARADALYQRWRGEAKVAQLRKQKRASSLGEGGAATGGGGSKRPRRPVAEPIDGDGDASRDARRDFILATEDDIESEINEWQAASASAPAPAAGSARGAAQGPPRARRRSAPTALPARYAAAAADGAAHDSDDGNGGRSDDEGEGGGHGPSPSHQAPASWHAATAAATAHRQPAPPATGSSERLVPLREALALSSMSASSSSAAAAASSSSTSASASSNGSRLQLGPPADRHSASRRPSAGAAAPLALKPSTPAAPQAALRPLSLLALHQTPATAARAGAPPADRRGSVGSSGAAGPVLALLPAGTGGGVSAGTRTTVAGARVLLGAGGR